VIWPRGRRCQIDDLAIEKEAIIVDLRHHTLLPLTIARMGYII